MWACHLTEIKIKTTAKFFKDFNGSGLFCFSTVARNMGCCNKRFFYQLLIAKGLPTPNIDNDEDLILDVLSSEKILLVQGSAFNIPDNHHFRIVFLPTADQLSDALVKIGGVLEKYHSL